MTQVSKEHYHFSQYTGKTRWTSYWHQLDEVLKTNSSSVLVVGVGDGIVPGIIALIMENPEGAVHYAGTQRKYLDRYLLDGRLEISNNRAERRVKPFVIGRKNWLFANTPKAPRPAR